MDAQAVRALLEKGPLLFDGATGTYARTIADWPEGPVENACLSAQHKVCTLHQAYMDAGCMAVKTNTFAAHIGFAAQSADHQEQIVRAAVAAAMKAAGEHAAVFADLGPVPAGCDAEKEYIQLADDFLDLGVSCFLFETMSSADGIERTAAHIRGRNPHAFIAVSFAANPDGFTRAGESASALIAQLDRCPDVDAVGLNCICGAYHLRRLIESLPPVNKHLIAMPNAGYPHVIDGRTYYDSDPVYYAQQVMTCVARGAKIIGGCCGTTPEHMRVIAAALKKNEEFAAAKSEPSQKESGKSCKSRIAQKLARGGRPILVELDPPRDSGIVSFLAGASGFVMLVQML